MHLDFPVDFIQNPDPSKKGRDFSQILQQVSSPAKGATSDNANEEPDSSEEYLSMDEGPEVARNLANPVETVEAQTHKTMGTMEINEGYRSGSTSNKEIRQPSELVSKVPSLPPKIRTRRSNHGFYQPFSKPIDGRPLIGQGTSASPPSYAPPLPPSATQKALKFLEQEGDELRRTYEESQGVEKERSERERLERERSEKQRLEREKLKRERLKRDQLEKEKSEAEKLQKKASKERVEKEKLENEQLESYKNAPRAEKIVATTSFSNSIPLVSPPMISPTSLSYFFRDSPPTPPTTKDHSNHTVTSGTSDTKDSSQRLPRDKLDLPNYEQPEIATSLTDSQVSPMNPIQNLKASSTQEAQSTTSSGESPTATQPISLQASISTPQHPSMAEKLPKIDETHLKPSLKDIDLPAYDHTFIDSAYLDLIVIVVWYNDNPVLFEFGRSDILLSLKSAIVDKLGVPLHYQKLLDSRSDQFEDLYPVANIYGRMCMLEDTRLLDEPDQQIPINLRVVRGGSKKHSVTVSTLSKRVSEFKEEIAEVIGAPAKDQKLVFNGAILGEDRTLESYHITESSEITVFLISLRRSNVASTLRLEVVVFPSGRRVTLSLKDNETRDDLIKKAQPFRKVLSVHPEVFFKGKKLREGSLTDSGLRDRSCILLC